MVVSSVVGSGRRGRVRAPLVAAAIVSRDAPGDDRTVLCSTRTNVICPHQTSPSYSAASKTGGSEREGYKNHMSIRRIGGVAIVAVLALLSNAPAAMAATHRSECGQFTYTAPDPSGPTTGHLVLGLITPWTIAADATISPAVTSAASGLSAGNVTCLGFDLDGSGVITALDFASQGTISGHVAFDAINDGYVIASRLELPTQVLTQIPGLGVIFTTTAAAGTTATLTITVDTASGQVTGFVGHSAFCGKAHIAGGGDAVIGAATVAAAFLDAGDVSQINGAGSRKVCATIQSIGAVSNSGPPDVQTSVVLSVAAAGGATVTPPPTSTEAADVATSSTNGAAEVLGLLGVFFLALVGGLRRRSTRTGDRAI